jgi:hypothetical protein
METEFFTTAQAAKKLNIPEPTFRLYRSQGLIQGAKPGKNWIHSGTDLTDFYERHKVKTINASDYLVNQRKG